ncbi:MAG: hypothetical protein RIR96_875 [Bacteroidota bacterium]|jgi:hypothetical protein
MRLFILHIIFPIFIGVILYLVFSSTNLIFYKWVQIEHFENILFSIRESTSKIRELQPKWVMSFLPDALWSYSFTSSLVICWNFYNNYKVIFLFFLPFFTGVTIEIMQFEKIIPGTADYYDIIAYLIGTKLSLIILQNVKTNYYEKESD